MQGDVFSFLLSHAQSSHTTGLGFVRLCAPLVASLACCVSACRAVRSASCFGPQWAFILPALRVCARLWEGAQSPLTLGQGKHCPQVISNHGKVVLEKYLWYDVAAAHVWILLVPWVSSSKWIPLEGVRLLPPTPQFSAYVIALQNHSPPLIRSTAPVAAVTLHSYGVLAVGKDFQVGRLRFLKAKIPAGYVPALQQWYGCCVRPGGPCLTDALFLFFLQVDLQVSPMSLLLAVYWGTRAGAAVMTTLKVLCLPLFLSWQLVTVYLSSVRHHSKSLLMQSHPLTLLKSSSSRRAQWS